MNARVIDLFAGPGGWDVGAAELGLYPLGIEQDESACATRAAAGHLTLQADVRAVELGTLGRVEGLIASPPCQAFSSAGKGEGREWLPALHQHVRSCVTGWSPWPHDADPKIALVLEPLRYAIGLVPEWIALEQVPPVAELWETFAYVLRALGWECWTGVLNAADFGVPQTRERAFLLAHRRFQPQPPTPTHCKGGGLTMFGELLPWVSMADALGWDGAELRYPRGTGMVERHGERRDHPMVERHGERRDHPMVEPSPVIRSKARSATWVRTGSVQSGVPGTRHEQPCEEPAPTVTSRADLWQVGEPWILDRRQTGAPTLNTSVVPAPTLTAAAIGKGIWTLTRPATTVQGDPRLAAPGHRDREGGEPQFGPDALRLTVADALRLQSFPADYPVQGTKTKQFEQIGNAVPPLLARHVLASLVSPSVSVETGNPK